MTLRKRRPLRGTAICRRRHRGALGLALAAEMRDPVRLAPAGDPGRIHGEGCDRNPLLPRGSGCLERIFSSQTLRANPETCSDMRITPSIERSA